MSKLGNFFKNSTLDVKKVSGKDMLMSALRATSGGTTIQRHKFDIFNNIIAFKGVNDGVGVSTIVSNTALALCDLGLTVCVLDTSFLNPAQDVLLHSDLKDKIGKANKNDWLEMPYTRENVVNIVNSKLAVLSMTDRDITDMIERDSADLVGLALYELENKFDIILIDICNEPTSLATECMIKSHMLFQVWSNASHVLHNVETFITNCTTCCCTIDKMRNVIINQVVDTVGTNWGSVLDKYNCNLVCGIPMSYDIAECNVKGEQLYNTPSTSQDIEAFNNGIVEIISKFISIADTSAEYDTLNAIDILEGRVEGTLSEQLHKTASVRPILQNEQEVGYEVEDYEDYEEFASIEDKEGY